MPPRVLDTIFIMPYTSPYIIYYFIYIVIRLTITRGSWHQRSSTGSIETLADLLCCRSTKSFHSPATFMNIQDITNEWTVLKISKFNEIYCVMDSANSSDCKYKKPLVYFKHIWSACIFALVVWFWVVWLTTTQMSDNKCKRIPIYQNKVLKCIKEYIIFVKVSDWPAEFVLAPLQEFSGFSVSPLRWLDSCLLHTLHDVTLATAAHASLGC